MKVSEVIEKLKQLKDKHGDVQFCIENADTSWVFKVSDGCFEFVDDSLGARIEVGATYGDEIG